MEIEPLVSFCIATRNRGPILVDCLRRVMECGLPRNQFEVLVVDNGSTDGTTEMVARSGLGVEWMALGKNCGPVAKNVAMKRARGEFIVILDDDAYPLPGAVAQMVRHFRADADLAAAVFDVTLPEGGREASAYPDVFIGAGTGLRASFLRKVGLLPAEFFMQAEEYDLSFRLLDAGGKVRRFGDLPLMHLKSPAARIGQRTTRLDVRNNMYLLAKYIPAPLCHELAADWLARYWWMAEARDAAALPYALRPVGSAAPKREHRKAYLDGAAEGMAKWTARRAGGKYLLKTSTIETIFKFDLLARRMREARERIGLRRILFADVGKNMLGYWRAARGAGVEVVGIMDENLAAAGREYRGVPVVREGEGLAMKADAVVVSNLSPVQGPRRAAGLRRVSRMVVVELMEGSGAGVGAEGVGRIV